MVLKSFASLVTSLGNILFLQVHLTVGSSGRRLFSTSNISSFFSSH